MQSNDNNPEENNSLNNSKIPKFEVSVIEENELNANQNNTEIVSPFIVQLEEGFDCFKNQLIIELKAFSILSIIDFFFFL
jgi:hypothetical protein